MFTQLFSESGLSLDRLRSLLEVGAAGSIAKAAAGDPVRQSQYSRQIKELEDFFRTRLIERAGKGTRLTAGGRELARISRFFMLGLSNFKRGCLAEEQTLRVAAGGTFLREFLLPLLASPVARRQGARYITEPAGGEEIERRLHDLTLDFGVVTRAALSRPLQTRRLRSWKLELWIPKALRQNATQAARALEKGELPLALARELEPLGVLPSALVSPTLSCDSFLDARQALEGEALGAWVPDFLVPGAGQKRFIRVPQAKVDSLEFAFYLAWNPRLLRLNPPAARKRDWLAQGLAEGQPA